VIPALLILVVYIFVLWLVFVQLKIAQFSIAWGVISGFVGIHLILIFLIGLRFVTPYSTDAIVVQHTIQIIPRLPEPTLVTAVLVEPNVPIRKGQPLFQFDRRPYQYKVNQLEAQLAQAKQNVLVLGADYDAALQKVAAAKSELEFANEQELRARGLAKHGAGPQEDAQKWAAQTKVDQASVKAAVADAETAHLRYESQIGGVNTTVVATQADLDQARYYLDNTTLVAPEDGYVINLQVRPGMVAGYVRVAAIASFICDADRYVLAAFSQQSLKYVKPGQPVEVAFDLYPGQIFKGRVATIWRVNREGQYIPSGYLPRFTVLPPEIPEKHFAVIVTLDDRDQSKFPIGAQGAAAVYVHGGGFAAMRRIGIRAHSWMNWLYPIPF